MDHRRPAARGGPTSQFNARIGCWPHNRRDELRDDVEPLPERDITILDDVRARCRWFAHAMDGLPDDEPRHGPWH